jgi:hypothetical protein
MTSEDMEAIFDDIDAGLDRFKIAILVMQSQHKTEAATRRIIALARTLQSMGEDDDESFSRNH